MKIENFNLIFYFFNSLMKGNLAIVRFEELHI